MLMQAKTAELSHKICGDRVTQNDLFRHTSIIFAAEFALLDVCDKSTQFQRMHTICNTRLHIEGCYDYTAL